MKTSIKSRKIPISQRLYKDAKREQNSTDNLKKIHIFCREDNKKALIWAKKIEKWINREYPLKKIIQDNPDVIIALGGDGSILEAAKKFKKNNPLIIGLNLGTIGFLSAVRHENNFLKKLKDFFEGRFTESNRIMLEAKVIRKRKEIYSENALNDIAVQNILGICEIEVRVNRYPIQYIRGTGVLISTATGSTAYNLSAHGPIVMPKMKCIIINELLDHNIPTPSIIVDSEEKIHLNIGYFREHKIFTLKRNGQAIDVAISTDGGKILPLKRGDSIHIKRSKEFVRFVEFEDDYFLKSLQEKFTFE